MCWAAGAAWSETSECRCVSETGYEPSEKYKAIYHPQIPLRCSTVQFDQEFIDQYLQEISGDLEVNFSDFFKEKGKFYLPNVNRAMQSLYAVSYTHLIPESH